MNLPCSFTNSWVYCHKFINFTSIAQIFPWNFLKKIRNVCFYYSTKAIFSSFFFDDNLIHTLGFIPHVEKTFKNKPSPSVKNSCARPSSRNVPLLFTWTRRTKSSKLLSIKEFFNNSNISSKQKCIKENIA